MLRDSLADMLRRLVIANVGAMAEGDIADIFIETVLLRIAIPVGLIGAHRMLIPLAGKDALPADGFKTAADPADTGKQIDKAEPIVRMMGRRRRQQRRQMSDLLRTQTPAARPRAATRLRIAALQCCSPTLTSSATSVFTS